MSDWFPFQGFMYPPYQRPSDGSGTSGMHHDDDYDEGDDDGDEDDEDYVDQLCLFVVWVCRPLSDTIIFVCSSGDVYVQMPAFW